MTGEVKHANIKVTIHRLNQMFMTLKKEGKPAVEENMSLKARKIMAERFGRDTLLSIATVDEGKPYVRIVNSYYENGAFYTVTHGLTNKMKQIAKNPVAAVCGEWFTGHGIGGNLGPICEERNFELAQKLRTVFSEWYQNGHTNESDPNTCILRVRLTEGILFDDGKRYDVDFTVDATK